MRAILITTLLCAIAVLAAGIAIDDADARRFCLAKHSAATCNHIMRG